MSDIFFKTVFVNILHKAAIAGQNHLSVCQHMRHIHMQGFQNSRAVCNLSLIHILLRYPHLTLVGNAKTFAFVSQFYDLDLTGRTLTVKEGDTLCLGSHTLHFFLAPMVHWPEVMVTYEETEQIL